MTMRERCEKAVTYRRGGANCAQSLLAAFADVLGIAEEQALRVGAGLGGGVRSGNICGAVNAPVMMTTGWDCTPIFAICSTSTRIRNWPDHMHEATW